MTVVLVADDMAENRRFIAQCLKTEGLEILTASDGIEALAGARAVRPDLVILDVRMPGKTGLEVCRALKQDADFPFTPVMLVTGVADRQMIAEGFEAGADEYVTKPIDPLILRGRVKALLRTKELYETVRTQSDRIEQQMVDLAALNASLEADVAAKAEQIVRMSRLKRLVAPQVAEIIVSSGLDNALASHRREITVAFFDLRGFTGFAQSADPEDVMDVLREYHEILGDRLRAHEGTVEHFAGDGLMAFFNDPIPQEDHTERAVRVAIEARAAMAVATTKWRVRRGITLGLGIGITRGFATLGYIGFADRLDYAAIGPVANLAARLCGEAAGGQILIGASAAAAVEDVMDIRPAGLKQLKGIAGPTSAFEVVATRDAPRLVGAAIAIAS